MHETSLEKMVRRVVQIKNINRRSGPIDIHWRVVHKQIIYINRRSGPIDIYTSEGCPQTNKTKILIRGLGECERVGEDSGSELVM